MHKNNSFAKVNFSVVVAIGCANKNIHICHAKIPVFLGKIKNIYFNRCYCCYWRHLHFYLKKHVRHIFGAAVVIGNTSVLLLALILLALVCFFKKVFFDGCCRPLWRHRRNFKKIVTHSLKRRPRFGAEKKTNWYLHHWAKKH